MIKYFLGELLTQDHKGKGSYFNIGSKILELQIKSNKKSYEHMQYSLFKNQLLKLSENTIKKQIKEGSLFLDSESFFCLNAFEKKGIMGFRNNKIISLGLSKVLYSIGVYYYYLTYKTIDKKEIMYKNGFNSKSYHGHPYIKGKKWYEISFEENYIVSYNNYIKEFINIGKNFKEKEKTVIYLDIRDYYDNVKISKLNESISKDVKSSIYRKEIIERGGFTKNIQNDINNLFEYYFDGSLPQTQNNFFSSYLGDLYLTEFDFFIDNLLKLKKISGKMIRYVDDIRIIIDKKLGIEDCFNIIQEIEEFILLKLGLKLNYNKTKIDYISNNRELYAKTNIKSYNDSEIKSENKIENKIETKKGFTIDLFIKSLESISKYNETQITIKDQDLQIINKIFDKENNRERKKLEIKEKNEKVVKILEKINIIYIIQAKQFLFYIIKYYFKEIFNKLVIKITENKININSYEIIHFLYYKFGEENIINKKNKEISVKEVIKKVICKYLEKEDIDKDNSINLFYNIINNEQVIDSKKLNFTKFSSILSGYDIINQAILLQIAYKKKDFNSSLNHLLNIVHSFLYKKYLEDEIDIKNFNFNHVDKVLAKLKIENGLRLKISNMFDRRNSNPVSHGGTLSDLPVSINKDEFDNRFFVFESIFEEFKKHQKKTFLQ